MEFSKLAKVLRGCSSAQPQLFRNLSRAALGGNGRIFVVRLCKEFHDIASTWIANGTKELIHEGIHLRWSTGAMKMSLVSPCSCRLLSRHNYLYPLLPDLGMIETEANKGLLCLYLITAYHVL